MAEMTLVIGNRTYSSWSLRAWLALQLTGARVSEILIPLDQPDTEATIARWTPTGRVPVLVDGDLTIPDSLAIVEYLAEVFPQAGLWPAERAARARARAIVAEMHSGFAALRRDMPMDLKHDQPGRGHTAEALADALRVQAIWRTALASSGGPFLFGAAPSAADCFFAPVATRFRTYAVPLDDTAAAYVDHIFRWPPMAAWQKAAQAEPWAKHR